MKIRITNKSNNQNPSYQTSGSSGMDLRAFIPASIVLHPGQRILVPTGIYLEIPQDCEAQVRSRSGLALKKGIIVLNSPGTIDADYRGEIGVILFNSSKNPYEIKPSERIAQLVFARIVKVNLENSSALDKTERSSGGFGSTGTN
jgi:dUTP pyrophosphatase